MLNNACLTWVTSGLRRKPKRCLLYLNVRTSSGRFGRSQHEHALLALAVFERRSVRLRLRNGFAYTAERIFDRLCLLIRISGFRELHRPCLPSSTRSKTNELPRWQPESCRPRVIRRRPPVAEPEAKSTVARKLT